MIYTDFKGKRMPMLGFGAMRLPTLDGKEIDEAQVDTMVEYAMSHGVNYFDTAYPYHGGKSEIVMGRVLSKYPRESYYLASKYPGHQYSSSYDPAEIFEEQLKKCGVDHFDFYLLHNVCESSIDVYLDERWGIIDYFKEQRRLGRIKHLGFSTHARIDALNRFLDTAGSDMEFCQIQLNWLDLSLQNAKEKVEILNSRSIPIWVMEPVRGGRLCKLGEEQESRLRALHPDWNIPSWSFRFLTDIEGVTVILSGMSNMEQIIDNIHTFEEKTVLKDNEREELLCIAEEMKNSVPCTACGYCLAGCPRGLNIPMMISTCNDLRFANSTNTAMWLEDIPEDKLPSACISCGKCMRICPQGIEIPKVLSELNERLKSVTKWHDICREREEMAKKLKASKK